MFGPMRRWRTFVIIAAVFVGAFYVLMRRDPEILDRYKHQGPIPKAPPVKIPPPPHHEEGQASSDYLRLEKLPDRYPVTSFKELPLPASDAAAAGRLVPAIQKPKPKETSEERDVRKARLEAVKASFLRSWEGYKENAWMADEVQPLSATPRQDYEKLGGWSATLVDTLDTLWILGLRDEFRMAVRACEAIDFGVTDADTVHVFETTIRYLGGFLGAYEISGKAYPQLLHKATEIGEILLGAFDTPNRLPMGRWDWLAYALGEMQTSAPTKMLSAEIGTLSLEFTRLTQLTGDVRFYDAVQRISDVLAEHQQLTRLPGMWPVEIDASKPAFDQDNLFTINGKADSLFEYLPKQWLLLGGALDQPRQMYEKWLPVAKKHIFRRVVNAWNLKLLLPGEARVTDDPMTGKAIATTARGEHLGCFAGGMVGLAARAFGGPDENDNMDLAAQLTDGCVWSYNVTATGIGPEKFFFASCGGPNELQTGLRCVYSEDKWRAALKEHWKQVSLNGGGDGNVDDGVENIMKEGRIPPGMLDVDNPHYLLRPEAIESIFVMWRLTGDKQWQEKAWRMFQHVVRHTGAAPGSGNEGQVAAAAVEDVLRGDSNALMDRMESFWLAETLKYFYLVFEDFDVLSLDEWVFNTEAHPFRRAVFPSK
ncbi:mannosyl-oligosaccharide alpha-1,2-mannosidase [Sporothrix brasiliensis 5110]|uniref:alpha-1,2-Mannosidase n=1 Tax=Sporothrix brasiliensis 5110 TaxID=1398154 RepID=A0A0C2IUM5_9PEZI|nr:mannosyl-oligosaccharide alpha-1,2-mannosidase [Sporothrix brasiliensis 5110]KIH88672.1 mannosyl-oligosaccharide alpha-1,2-mannosidase [Sporothrix brasiliensis 5110]